MGKLYYKLGQLLQSGQLYYKFGQALQQVACVITMYGCFVLRLSGAGNLLQSGTIIIKNRANLLQNGPDITEWVIIKIKGSARRTDNLYHTF